MDELTPIKKEVRPVVTSITAIHLVEQAELFDDLDKGSELLTIEADKTSRKHNASTLERRQELYDAICERLVSGMSIREVAKVFKVSRNTVGVIVKRLEDSQKVEPYKKRLAAKMGQIVELSAEIYLEKLELGLVPVNVLPVGAGIFSDKKALLDGDPTMIVGKSAQGFNEGEWERFLAENTKPKGPVIDVPSETTPADSQSTENPTKGQ